jgi:hypothetical protein
MLPAACQGIVGVVARADDSPLVALLQQHVCDAPTMLAATVERAVLLQLMLTSADEDVDDGIRRSSLEDPSQLHLHPLELHMPQPAVAVLAEWVPNRACVDINALVADPGGVWMRRATRALPVPAECSTNARLLLRDDVLRDATAAGRAVGQQLRSLAAAMGS